MRSILPPWSQAAKRPCAVTLRVRRRAPKLLSPQLAHCRARWARLTSIGNDSFLGAGLFRCREISPLRRRGGGFALAPSTPSQCTPMLLDFYCCRGFRIHPCKSNAQILPHSKSRRVLPAAAFVIHRTSTFRALIPHPCPRTLPVPSSPPPSRRRGGRSTS